MSKYDGSRRSRRQVLGFVGGLGLSIVPRLSRAQCELIELRPGYPGYAGYVTGVDGVGDHACLDDILRTNSSFDPVAELEQNQVAAAQVGLTGGPAVWTWENWIVIEAVRGLLPTCYSCALLDAARRPEPRGMPVAVDDPRLLLGGFETTTALYRLAAEHGLERSSLEFFFKYDHRLRALVGMVSPGHWNALQVLDGYDQLMEIPNMRGSYIDPIPLWRNLVAQGGYAPTPATSLPEDQLFMVWTGALALNPHLTSEAMMALLRRLEYAESTWKGELAMGSSISFADFLRGEAQADQWF